MLELLLTFLAAALFSNLVLSTGFGSSLLLRVTRRPKELLWFSGTMLLFAVLTTISTYYVLPLFTFKGGHYLRPLAIIVAVTVLYLLAVLLLKKALPALYKRVELWLPMAAYNNVVVGVCLLANHQIAVTLLGAIGMAAGACVGFCLLSLLVAEAREQMDHSDMPRAFRGLPVTLLWFGLMALAMLGFSSSISFM